MLTHGNREHGSVTLLNIPVGSLVLCLAQERLIWFQLTCCLRTLNFYYSLYF